MKRNYIFIATAVLAASLATGTAVAARPGNNPLTEVLSLLADPDFGLQEIKAGLDSLAQPRTVTRSTGKFGLPAQAVSVDWTVINNSDTAQTFTATVYRTRIGMAKTIVAPGPITVTLDPGFTTHNANSVGPGMPFQVGGAYEVVIEGSPRLTPSADVWQDLGNTVIPGTTIPPGAWVRID